MNAHTHPAGPSRDTVDAAVDVLARATAALHGAELGVGYQVRLRLIIAELQRIVRQALDGRV